MCCLNFTDSIDAKTRINAYSLQRKLALNGAVLLKS